MKSVDLIKTINWLDEMEIKNYSINPDLSVDVDGDVDLEEKGLTEIPIQFGMVSGWFTCSYNNLTTLEGAPEKVGRSFWCNDNQLTSLEGAPEKVGRSFNCENNQLTTLEGAPEEIGRSFDCSGNKKKFSKKEVRSVCKVGGDIYV